MFIIGDVRFNLIAIIKQPLYLFKYRDSNYYYENKADNRVLLVWACDKDEMAIATEEDGSILTQVFCDYLQCAPTGSINVINLILETTKALKAYLKSDNNPHKGHFQTPQVEQIEVDEEIIVYKGME